MKIVQLIVIIIVGIAAILVEFRTIKSRTIFPNIFEYIPIYALWFFTILFVIINGYQFRKSRTIAWLLPCIIGSIFLFVHIYHQKQRERSDESESIIIAHTSTIGSEGGFQLDFKKDGRLKARKLSHWLVTSYWGNYLIKDDTIILDIDLDFDLRKEAIRTDSILIFSVDTIFRIIKKY